LTFPNMNPWNKIVSWEFIRLLIIFPIFVKIGQFTWWWHTWVFYSYLECNALNFLGGSERKIFRPNFTQETTNMTTCSRKERN
jgi:hypothetical protein